MLGAMRNATAPLFAVALTLMAGCSEEDPHDHPAPQAPDREELEERGEALYRQHCALCHGRDGEGYEADDAPRLNGQELLRSASDEYLTTAIRDGRPGTAMSAWSRAHGGPLNDLQIQAIIEYLRSWQRHPQASVDDIRVEGDVARGRGLYLLQCSRCHGVRGEGLNAPQLANPVFQASASDGFIQYAIAHGRAGTPMPAFRDTLEPAQIADLTAFVRALGRGGAPVPPTPEVPPDLPQLEEMDLIVNPDAEPASLGELRDERFVPAAAVHRELEAGKRIVIIDARATSDWLRQRIPGAIPVPFYQLDSVLEGLPRDGTPMVAYCGCPHAASGRVVDALREHGFTNTAVIDEGIDHWAEQDYPTADGPDQP